MASETPIQSFYNGVHILITGGTGFMGKALTEKLIRSCPGVAKLYLLIRDKKGQNGSERLELLLKDQVFSRMQEECPDYRQKIEIISGDCSLPELGLSKEDRLKVLLNVNIVFHGAATVKFDENIKLATAINISGTKEIIRMCKQIENLQSLVHISTAYSNSNRSHIEEKFYDPPSCSSRIVEMCSLLTPAELDNLTPSLLETWPNTYVFTKALAEHFIKHEEGQFPVCIFRPAIVTSSYKDPVPGWIDNKYGPTGLAIGCGVGLIRVINADVNLDANFVPVDLTVNAIIASAKETHRLFTSGVTEIKIYNYVSCKDNPIKWGEYMNIASQIAKKCPPEQAIWYMSVTMVKNLHLTVFLSILLHFIPAFFIDIFAFLIGKKPQMVKIYKKILQLTKTLSYFTTRPRQYENGNVTNLIEATSEADKELFNFDIKTIDWLEYMNSYTKGAKEFLLLEPQNSSQKALNKWKRLYWMHQFVKCILFYGLAKAAYMIYTIIFSRELSNLN